MVDVGSMAAELDGKPMHLTTHEFRLLHALSARSGRVLTREQIVELLHGTSEAVFDRSIDVHVYRLRRKLEEDPRNPRWLKTIRGVGYMLVEPQ